MRTSVPSHAFTFFRVSLDTADFDFCDNIFTRMHAFSARGSGALCIDGIVAGHLDAYGILRKYRIRGARCGVGGF